MLTMMPCRRDEGVSSAVHRVLNSTTAAPAGPLLFKSSAGMLSLPGALWFARRPMPAVTSLTQNRAFISERYVRRPRTLHTRTRRFAFALFCSVCRRVARAIDAYLARSASASSAGVAQSAPVSGWRSVAIDGLSVACSRAFIA